ncbi:hypothetical protein DES47_104128 [Roseateles toxinivorans]|uniref:MalT-like TPR region domain-containing protein n=2 Tax=Roseateles toxinivorans TaxID=270368 RepID=A0A4R6QJE8_9BURK|nr:hypothetical protein DES47_104128 [Roseateles toxinivorans]
MEGVDAPSRMKSQLRHCQTLLEQAEQSFELARFDEVLCATDAVLRVVDDPIECRSDELLFQALMLRVRCRLKFERFDVVLKDCQRLLGLVALDQPSLRRAELLINMSFAHSQLAMHELALRGARMAWQDAQALKNIPLASRAIERVAMCHLALGDAVEAERFMQEALGLIEQQGSTYERVQRYSNALHMVCGLHDSYLAQDNPGMALGLLARASRVVAQGSAAAQAIDSEYLRTMWEANVARWLRRRGEAERAQAELLRLADLAGVRGWAAIRRSAQLEMALIAEVAGQRSAALDLLRALFDPPELRVRDGVALPALEAQVRLHAAVGDSAAVARVLEQLVARRSARAAAVRQAREQLPGAGMGIMDTLSQTGR